MSVWFINSLEIIRDFAFPISSLLFLTDYCRRDQWTCYRRWRGIIAAFGGDEMKAALVFAFAAFTAVSIAAQTKTVTNSDLEKFRAKRVAAERDYRENYTRMGFPSPEELDRQSEKSRVERQELSARLRAERLERERNDLLLAEADRRQTATVYFVTGNGQGNSGTYFNYYQPGNSWWFRRGWRPVVRYPYPDNIGNGNPLINYYGTPNVPRRPVRFFRVN